MFPGARPERFHRDRPFPIIYSYPVKNPATDPIENPRRSEAIRSGSISPTLQAGTHRKPVAIEVHTTHPVTYGCHGARPAPGRRLPVPRPTSRSSD